MPSYSIPKLRRAAWELEIGLLDHSCIDFDDASVGSIVEKEKASLVESRNDILSSFRKALCLLSSAIFISSVTFTCVYFATYWAKANLALDNSCPVPKWDYPNCGRRFTHEQPDIPSINTPERWLEVRQKYQESVRTSSLSAGWQGLYKTSILEQGGETVQRHNDGFVSPVEFKHSPGKGRGVYASAHISEGQKIWDNRYSGIFDSECAAKVFFSKLTEKEQCSIMFWGYSHNFRGHGFQFTADFDGHAYFNQCSAKDANTVHHYSQELNSTEYGLPHILSLSLPHSISEDTLKRRSAPGSQGLYATRDIMSGEELCFDYNDIHRVALFDYYSQLWAHALDLHQWFEQ
jgi:hypothetical protein